MRKQALPHADPQLEDPNIVPWAPKSPDALPSAPVYFACPVCSLDNTFAKIGVGGGIEGAPATVHPWCQGHTTQRMRVSPQPGEAAAEAAAESLAQSLLKIVC